jgi:hypothetical protein
MTLRDALREKTAYFTSAISIFFYSILWMILTDVINGVLIPRWMWAVRLVIFTASGLVSVSILLLSKHEPKPQEKGRSAVPEEPAAA